MKKFLLLGPQFFSTIYKIKMRELIKGGINGEMLIGYTSMMATTSKKENSKVYKLLRLLSSDEQEGDLHFFEYKNEKWILVPDKSFINSGLIKPSTKKLSNIEIGCFNG
jgi:hypothetical protein